ncbi:hypothetical protein HS088_TW12G00302 [Tripterygium wilfordii]|uniref:Uncharacterized protein n=1 Tax=Tripterygium wilfordii TaxID=458696 RepID=A0A7J7CYE9_TRIWF|nr:uncharacterized protein LOC120010903 [Tripterygium wilfordii]KAF5739103.1 hypothetical protein HS088_TW12G00302 [Tripterygium wilfordii]
MKMSQIMQRYMATMDTTTTKRSANLQRREHAGIHGEKTSTRSSLVAETKPATAANYKLESKASIDINDSAEAFIKKFRQQLLIQRLESIENFEQMLARGL